MKLHLVAYVYRGVDLETHVFLDPEKAQEKFEELKESEYNEKYDSIFIEKIELPVEILHLQAELACACSKICAAKLEREYQLKFAGLCKLIGQPLAESPDDKTTFNWLFTLDSANGRCTIHEAELGDWWDILSMNIADFASACELAMLVVGKMKGVITCAEQQRKSES